MGHNSYSSDSKFEKKLIKEGNHLGICYSFIDLGTHAEDYMGNIKNIHKVQIGWELSNLKDTYTDKDGNEQDYIPVIFKDYTDSLNEKANLRKDLVGWRGKDFTVGELKGFEMKSILGTACLLNIIHKVSKTGNSYEKIQDVTKVPDGMNLPELSRATRFLSFQEQPYDENLLNSLPEFLQNKIRQSPEYNADENQTFDDGTPLPEKPAKTQDEINEANSDIPF